MTSTNRYTIVVVAGISLLVAYGLLFLLGPDAVHSYSREDGVVETIGAASLLAASVFFLLTLIRLRHDPECGRILKLSLVVLSILFFFGAGEEISWGQRIFGFDTPSKIDAINAQGEANVHNIEVFGGAVNSDRLFQAFWVTFAVLLPLAAALSPKVRGWAKKLVPIFPVWIALLLIVNQIVAELSSMIAEQHPSLYAETLDFGHARFEVTEMVVALIFAVGTFAIYRRASRSRESEPPLPDDDPGLTVAPGDRAA